jgi:hypothetical protein
VSLYSIHVVETDATGVIPETFTSGQKSGYSFADVGKFSIDDVKIYAPKNDDWYIQRKSLRLGNCRPSNTGVSHDKSPSGDLISPTSKFEASCSGQTSFSALLDVENAIKVPIPQGEKIVRFRFYVAQGGMENLVHTSWEDLLNDFANSFGGFGKGAAQCYATDLVEEVAVRYSQIPHIHHTAHGQCLNGVRLWRDNNGEIGIKVYEDLQCNRQPVDREFIGKWREDRAAIFENLNSNDYQGRLAFNLTTFPSTQYGRCMVTHLGFSMIVDVVQEDPQCHQVVVNLKDESYPVFFD